MKNKKIDIFINNDYICTTTQNKTLKSVIDKIKKDGFITYASINWLNKIILKDGDKIRATYQ